MRVGLRSAGQAQHLHYLPPVDGLRGVAVLAVLGFHAFPESVPGGFVGVDVFFVISGFLITGIIARHLERGEFSFAAFYARRVRRLFPALVLVLAATLSLGWLVLLPHEFRLLGKHILAAALFVANVAFWQESGYFDTDAEFKPLLHLWSLGIEEQFYLAWPVLLVILWKRRLLLLAVLSALVLASFTSSVSLASFAPVGNFYLPVSRFWELGVGCLLALLKERPSHAWLRTGVQESALRIVFCNIAPAIGIALIGTAIFVFDAHTPFPSWPALLPVLGTLLILSTPEQAWFQRRVLGSPVLVWTGLVSYALYLWHWPLLSFANIVEAGSLPNIVRWAALLLSFVLAWFTYRFVEVPVRRRKGFKINFALVTGAAVAGIAGFGVYGASGIPGRFDLDVQALRHGPSLDDLCKARIDGDKRVNYCRTTSAQRPNVVILGDSRAQAVYEGAAPLIAAEYSVMLLGRGGCPPLLNVRIRGYDQNEQECEDVWRTFVRYVQRAEPQVVVIVGNGSFLLTDPEIQLTRDGATLPESNEAVFEYGIISLMDALSRSSRVIHLGEIPAFATAPSCFLRPVRLPTTRCSPDLDRRQLEEAMRPYNAVLDRMQAAFPHVRFVNSVEILCAADLCSQWPVGGPILYSDALHLSPAGGRLLAEKAELSHLISQVIRVVGAE
jgi:peptidoglycan/LPS O-acetylase OafA/YrhL